MVNDAASKLLTLTQPHFYEVHKLRFAEFGDGLDGAPLITHDQSDELLRDEYLVARLGLLGVVPGVGSWHTHVLCYRSDREERAKRARVWVRGYTRPPVSST